jgi:hypothetical protein
VCCYSNRQNEREECYAGTNERDGEYEGDDKGWRLTTTTEETESCIPQTDWRELTKSNGEGSGKTRKNLRKRGKERRRRPPYELIPSPINALAAID